MTVNTNYRLEISKKNESEKFQNQNGPLLNLEEPAKAKVIPIPSRFSDNQILNGLTSNLHNPLTAQKLTYIAGQTIPSNACIVAPLRNCMLPKNPINLYDRNIIPILNKDVQNLNKDIQKKDIQKANDYGWRKGLRNDSLEDSRYQTKSLEYQQSFLQGYNEAISTISEIIRESNLFRNYSNKCKESENESEDRIGRISSSGKLDQQSSYNIAFDLGLNNLFWKNSLISKNTQASQLEFHQGYVDGHLKRLKNEENEKQRISKNQFDSISPQTTELNHHHDEMIDKDAYLLGQQLGSRNGLLRIFEYKGRGRKFINSIQKGYHDAKNDISPLIRESNKWNFWAAQQNQNNKIILPDLEKVDMQVDYYDIAFDLGLKNISWENSYISSKDESFQLKFHNGYVDGQLKRIHPEKAVNRQANLKNLEESKLKIKEKNGLKRKIEIDNEFIENPNTKRSKGNDSNEIFKIIENNIDPIIIPNLGLIENGPQINPENSTEFSAKDLKLIRFSKSRNGMVSECLIPILGVKNDNDPSSVLRFMYAYYTSNSQAIQFIKAAKKAIILEDDKNLNEVMIGFKNTNWDFIKGEGKMDVTTYEIKPEDDKILIPLPKLRDNPNALIVFSLVKKNGTWHFISEIK